MATGYHLIRPDPANCPSLGGHKDRPQAHPTHDRASDRPGTLPHNRDRSA
ncbi:MAG: hypothetical protein ACO331_14510 [Prochlorothrix sp.]